MTLSAEKGSARPQGRGCGPSAALSASPPSDLHDLKPYLKKKATLRDSQLRRAAIPRLTAPTRKRRK